MTYRFFYQLPLLLAAFFVITTVAPVGLLTVAHATPASKEVVNNANKKRKKKKTKKKKSKRKYTARGNPEVTRKVATQLIAEKLPDLAMLVDLPIPELAASSQQSDLVVTSTVHNGDTVTPVVAVSALAATAQPTTQQTAKPVPGGSYTDSELDETEDPDNVTAEDENDLAEEDEQLDINTFYKEFTSYMASLNGESNITYNGVDKVVMMQTLVDWLGTHYLFGGTTAKGIDCSAFTRMLYRTHGFGLPRTAAMQWGVGLPVEREDLQFGDLVFFHTRAAVYVSHVGIYLGNGMFAHASSRNGVTVSSLEADYYSAKFIGARRYDVNTVTTAANGIDVELN